MTLGWAQIRHLWEVQRVTHGCLEPEKNFMVFFTSLPMSLAINQLRRVGNLWIKATVSASGDSQPWYLSLEEPTASGEDSWFEGVLALNDRGEPAKALDLVYDKIEDWLHDGKFAECDAFLRRLNVESLPVRIVYAIAINTRMAADKLPHRSEFFERAWKTLERHGRDAKRLLGGLRNEAGFTKKSLSGSNAPR
jgi:hypothetical protein